ncbi:hypothetical protein B0A50_02005 [Salinomyces thailandicus]|uniref:Uncharacterized protein n=1 Tax=Salinomyces thailandicus TaxID=706561 RepID=A0A4U0U7N3_9PEZI|nr:hypothetical protein B0A50_02005 [Salinomyces thailandica]
MDAARASPGLFQVQFDNARELKRRSLTLMNKAIDFSSKAAITTLHVTYTAEMRGDQDTYMLGIDKAFTTLEQANARVELLGNTNTNPRSVETKLAQKNEDTGCLTISWGRYEGPRRFVAQVQKFEMIGSVLTEETGFMSPGDWDKESPDTGLYFADTQLDIPGHVWIVAVHDPDSPFLGALDSSSGVRRRHSLSRSGGHRRNSLSLRSNRSPSAASKLLFSTITEATPPLDTPPSFIDPSQRGLGWSLDSTHVNSEKALQRAKKAWNENFRSHGRCKKVREHYGFARFTLRPTGASKRDMVDYETCIQIRVERVRIVPEGELVSEFIGPVGGVFSGIQARAGQMVGRTVSIVPPLVNRNESGRAFEGDMVSTATGQRSSFVMSLQQIADDALKDGFDYEELPMAFKIRQEHMQRWGSMMDSQRYTTTEEKTRDSAADLYHAYLHEDTTAGSGSRRRKSKGKAPSKAGLRAKKRIAAAFGSSAAADDSTEDTRDSDVSTSVFTRSFSVPTASDDPFSVALATNTPAPDSSASIFRVAATPSPEIRAARSPPSRSPPSSVADRRREKRVDHTLSTAALSSGGGDGHNTPVAIPMRRTRLPTSSPAAGAKPSGPVTPPRTASNPAECFANVPWSATARPQDAEREAAGVHKTDHEYAQAKAALARFDFSDEITATTIRSAKADTAGPEVSIVDENTVSAGNSGNKHRKRVVDSRALSNDDTGKEVLPDGITLRKKRAAASLRTASKGAGGPKDSRLTLPKDSDGAEPLGMAYDV